MVAPAEDGRKRQRSDIKAACLIPIGIQEQLNKDFASARWLMGCPHVRFDTEGNIFYRQWPTATRELSAYRTVYPPPSSRADISATYTTYRQRRQGIVHQVKADGGRVEASMRNFRHIIASITEREMPQAESMTEIALGLLLFYHGKTPSETSLEEYEEAARLTFESLALVKLDPQRLIDEEKKKIMDWEWTGLIRSDSTGRLNDMIGRQASEAAARRAARKLLKLRGVAIDKYLEAYSACETERKMSRFIFTDIKQKLGNPDQVFAPHLNTFIHQLGRFIHLKGYKPVAQEVADILKEIRGFIESGNRSEAYRRRLFPKASLSLATELMRGEELLSVEHTV